MAIGHKTQTVNKITGTDKSDIMIGSRGPDFMAGGDGNDLMFGGWGDDVMLGGAGDDVLIGWHGNNFMAGGDGNDLEHFQVSAGYAGRSSGGCTEDNGARGVAGGGIDRSKDGPPSGICPFPFSTPRPTSDADGMLR